MVSKSIITAAAVSVIMAGCSMIPAYEKPASPVAASFPSGAAYAEADNGTANVAEIAWKDFFLAPELRALIEKALENNRDLRVAALNIESARAAYRIQRSNLLPDVNATGAFTRQRVPENASTTGSAYTASSYSVGIGIAAYELDFFGRVRSLSERALESYFATEEARNSAQITLISEVANAYITYLGDKEMLRLAEETLRTQKESYELIKKTYELGSATRLELEQAATAVENARISKVQYTRLTAQDLNALTLLAGIDIDESALQASLPDEVTALRALPAGVPSETLLNRPDIKGAEHSLKAANADIGAARAAFFPSITLTASAGLASSGLDDLFSSGSGLAWSFAPNINIPIFNAGRNKANLEVAKVSQKIAAAEYEKAIQTAFREVADQLAAKGTFTEQLEAQKSLAESTRRVYELADQRYKYGVSSYLEVLDAHRSLFAAEQGVISVRQQYLNNLVTLYKVLGGGQI
ncbi:efflux transporter outer membrane subunit [Geovibrio thiophilus]|uniref:Efflux transporter outer membrane subunit n=1 Tax=Geovibrio thiophilus TaxID=139438 RepID=A0A3R5V0J4_9BACT|nr:efflux transporter outer membrane subunit [Geovibrio thiophilus]QAR32620.1 efflux transporter outer membrane subunit [Geovibrio thiophilus]